ncbi:MAG: hypothetical protein JNL70_10050 [Saprospiraceae bacterium]|nr:hypothetical protein [Saprospiraceae bacterium]
MHNIEPFYRWREDYAVEDDALSPFHSHTYTEWKQVYNYLLHPLWDDFESNTLYLKVLMADYDEGYTIIELIGEWNDAVENDIRFLKRNVLESMLDNGISKFILIMENVLNFHGDGDDYYAEWAEECQDAFNGGWIVMLNTFDHVAMEMHETRLDNYVHFGYDFNNFNWRQYPPKTVLQLVERLMKSSSKRLT